jgi:ribosomal protein S18 acetylase RimI-like enzyme
MIIRRIRVEDAEAARALRLRALQSDPLAFGSNVARESQFPESLWLERATLGATSDSMATFLACEGDQCLGIAVTRRDFEARWGVYSVWVAPEARKQRVGLSLLLTLEAWARDHGARLLHLLVMESSLAARQLYQRAGFVFDGFIEASPHPGVVEHGMIKSLQLRA